MNGRNVGWEQARLFNHVEGGCRWQVLTHGQHQKGNGNEQEQVAKNCSRAVPEHGDEDKRRTNGENQRLCVVAMAD